MKQFKQMIWVFLFLASLIACNSGPNEPVGETKDQGREETKKIEAIGAVGYDGKAIRQKVDKMLDENDRRIKELEKATTQASGESE